VAVLLIHVFLWIALEKGREVPKPRQNVSTYLSVIQIGLKGPSIREHVIRDLEIPEERLLFQRRTVKRRK
jgi:hypothetical protein